MIKYLSCPDLHWSDVWLETSKNNLKAIIKAAREQKIDFVLFPGDLFDHAIYMTSKGSANDLIDLMSELTAICPVAAIYGTPSHDYAGCYGPLEKVGLQILQPGKMYGWWNGVHVGVKGAFITEATKETISHEVGAPDCLLFGLPEVTKSWYQAQHPDVSADAVNAAATNAVHDMIRNEYAPMRSAYPDIPAVLMLHGNVSDAMDRGSETDPVLKASDIVVRTSVLAEANFTRCELGHIHNPWESKRIEAGYPGYAGLDRTPWNHLDFVPAMTMVTIDGIQVVNKTRIPYGTPERRKISKPLAKYEPSIAYWLDTDDTAAVDPAKLGAHQWSRVTYRTDTQVERRVDVSGLESAKTLPELGKLYDPKITPAQLDKLAEAERNVPQAPVVQRDVLVSDVTVTGCTMFHGKTAHVEINKLPDGLVQIVGANGSGKSSLLGWCTPYPCFVGKDTDSGRNSAIKDFFDQPESGIQKIVYLNGVKHEHVITIRGAHTKTPKTDCYHSIEGVPQLEQATFDQMYAKSGELWGRLGHYVMTSFYVQPLQGKFESGLMTANMTTVRDLVQNIAGINHDAEKRYCLDKANEIDGATKEERIRIDTERGTIADVDSIKSDIDETEADLHRINECELPEAKQVVAESESAYTAAKSRYDHAQEQTERRYKISDKIEELRAKKISEIGIMDNLIAEADSSTEYSAKLSADISVKQAYNAALEQRAEVDKRNSDKQLDYQKTKSRMQEVLATVEQKKAAARDEYNRLHAEWQQKKYANETEHEKAKTLARRIIDINNPCPKCGYLDPAVKTTIDELQKQIDAISNTVIPPEPVYSDPELSTERAEYAQLMKIPQPRLETFTMPDRGLSDAEIAQYKQIVDSAASKRTEAAMIQNEIIPSLEKQIAELTAERDAIQIETVDITKEQSDLDAARAHMNEITAEISRTEAQITQLKQQLADNAKRRAELDKRESVLKQQLSDLADWQYLADMLSASKLPAMELDAVLDTIDTEATKQIALYRDGRYMYRSLTQKDGKSSVIDKFDIVVHDGETGEDKSLLKYSVGEKSFLSGSYVKALVKIRKTRTKTEYNPVISDEADSFIEIPKIPDYYEMEKNYYGSGSRVLVVSHSPDAGNYIQNHIDMKEILV